MVRAALAVCMTLAAADGPLNPAARNPAVLARARVAGDAFAAFALVADGMNADPMRAAPNPPPPPPPPWPADADDGGAANADATAGAAGEGAAAPLVPHPPQGFRFGPEVAEACVIAGAWAGLGTRDAPEPNPPVAAIEVSI